MDVHVHQARVRDRVDLAYVREGAGGFPLLLLHGWPETKRIWWRNVEPLVAAGFEVIVPDLAGFGDSGLADDDHYDVAAHARDMHALVSEVLGHERCITAGGDLGGLVLYDLSLRFEGFVARQVLFNTVPPILPDEYEAAGIAREIPREVRQAADYFMRQARDADGLAAELDTAEKRRRYVAQMYGPRFWAAPGSFGSGRGRVPCGAVRGRRFVPGVDRELRVRGRAPAGERGASDLREVGGPDAAALRAGGPRDPA